MWVSLRLQIHTDVKEAKSLLKYMRRCCCCFIFSCCCDCDADAERDAQRRRRVKECVPTAGRHVHVDAASSAYHLRALVSMNTSEVVLQAGYDAPDGR